MTTPHERLKMVLQAAGYSTTKQRLHIFDLLKDQEPMAINELISRARGVIDRASVYRTVEIFEQIGVVQRISIGWKYKIELGDLFAEHHHHITCLGCQKVVPINATELEKFVGRLAKQQEFDVVEHQIELQGYCKLCRRAFGETI